MEQERPDADDLPHKTWRCEACGATNSMWDGDCQWCEDTDQWHDTDYQGPG